MAETSLYIDQHLVDGLDEIAHERSSPGDHVSRSEVAQEAIEEFIEKHRSENNGGAEADAVEG